MTRSLSLIRTLHIEAAEDGTSGGSHRSLHDLVTGLRPFGVIPTVLFNEGNPFVERLASKGIDVHVWEDMRTSERKALRRLPSALRLIPAIRFLLRRARFLGRNPFDIVHLNNSPHTGHTDWLPATLIRRIPCLASMRGDATLVPSPRQTVIFRGFRRIVPVSTYVARSPTCRALPAERITVIPNGVDLERLRGASLNPAQRQELRSKVGLRPPQDFLAVMAGTVRRWKGQLNAVRALAQLPRPDLNRLKLILAGGWGPSDESYVRRIRTLVQETGLEGHVSLLGRRKDIPELFSAADVAVHASTTPEPFGLVVVEAMATGTPVLAAAGGGPAEILEEGGGLLHDPENPQELADRLSELMRDPSLRTRLSEEAYRIADTYSIERTRREMARLYHDLLSRPFPGNSEGSSGQPAT